jgi:H-NS histone family
LTISFAGARRVVTYCRNVTNALLDDPRVWAGVERLAKALYRRRYLSPRAVKKVLGDAFFADAGRMIRDSHGHPLAEALPLIEDCDGRDNAPAIVGELVSGRMSQQKQLERMDRIDRTIAMVGRRRVVRGGGSALKGMKVPPKYPGPSGETWAGRGAKPRWLVAAIKGGKKLDDFLID